MMTTRLECDRTGLCHRLCNVGCAFRALMIAGRPGCAQAEHRRHEEHDADRCQRNGDVEAGWASDQGRVAIAAPPVIEEQRVQMRERHDSHCDGEFACPSRAGPRLVRQGREKQRDYHGDEQMVLVHAGVECEVGEIAAQQRQQHVGRRLRQPI